jgi:hypothetical protein
MKNPTGEKNSIGLFFPYGRKNSTSMFDLGMFPPFGRNSPTHCFKWGFSPTVSGRISPKWTKWGKFNIPKLNMLKGYFLPYGKNYPIGFFSRGIFHGTANRSEKMCDKKSLQVL